MHRGNFRDNFQQYGNNKIQQKLSLSNFSGVESHLNAFGEQNLYIRNPSVPKTLKIIVFLSFNKGSFIKYW